MLPPLARVLSITDWRASGQGLAAAQYFNPAERRNGSWSCENLSARGAHRNITRKLRLTESNHAVRVQLDDVLENCILGLCT